MSRRLGDEGPEKGGPSVLRRGGPCAGPSLDGRGWVTVTPLSPGSAAEKWGAAGTGPLEEPQ